MGDIKKDELFFVIDSYSLDTVSSRLYGYVIEETGVYDVFYPGKLSGNGCYVRVVVENDKNWLCS